MTYEEAIRIIQTAIAEVEWEYPMEYAVAFETAIAAIEKQIPKKPRETRCALMCANCGHKITEKGCKKLSRSYCKVCGQADCDWLRMLEEDALSCDNCKWLGKRHQKCSCCRRNHGMKDNYEGKTP